MRTQPHRSETYRSRAEARIDAAWPGGLSAFLAEYESGRATLADLRRASGVEFRAARSILKSNDIQIKSASEACQIAHTMNPERSRAVGEQLRTSTSFHDPIVMAKCTASRKRLFRERPERHPNARAAMSRRERAFADLIMSIGLAFEFSRSVPPFWLDFWIPAIPLAVEIQRNQAKPCVDRDAQITIAIGCPIVYIPNHYPIEQPEWTKNLIAAFNSRRIDPSALGEYRMVVRCPKRNSGPVREFDGYKFVRPFM